MKTLRLVFLSDTHGDHEGITVPDGDILIYCGDCLQNGSRDDLQQFLPWLERQKAPRKVLIGGNHDRALEVYPSLSCLMIKELAPSVTYLQDSGCEIEGLKFWGSPYTPTFFNWYFMRDRGPSIAHHWNKIPDNTDVVLSHGPPFGWLDKSRNWNEATGRRFDDHLGCRDLWEAIMRIKPRIHGFGHIHGSHGVASCIHDDGYKTTMVNCSIMDESYNPINKPIEIEVCL